MAADEVSAASLFQKAEGYAEDYDLRMGDSSSGHNLFGDHVLLERKETKKAQGSNQKSGSIRDSTHTSVWSRICSFLQLDL